MPFAIVQALVDGVVTVSEEMLSRALLFLLERAKLVVEPAGAAGVAALLDPERRPSSRPSSRCSPAATSTRCCMLRVHPARHGGGRALPAVPAARARPARRLAELLGVLAEADANVLEVEHVRTGVRLRVDEVEIALQLETRGREHCRGGARGAARGGLPAPGLS